MRAGAALGLLFLAALLAEARAAESPPPEMRVCLEGGRTRLRIGSSRPPQRRHDEDVAGDTVLELAPKDGAGPVVRWSLPQSLDCVGFEPGKGFYVLDGAWEKGAVSAVRGFWYWPESAPKPVESKFQAAGQDALIRLWSPDYRYLVFVNTAGKLGALSTELDRVVILGAAPAPPPMGGPGADLLASGQYEKFDWEFFAEQGAGTLEPEILALEGGRVLKASDGADTVSARAKERRLRTWDLDQVFAAAAPTGSWSVVASGQRRPCAPKLDAGFVYWGTGDGRLLRASKTAKKPAPPATLARVSGAVRAVALDEDSLYAVVASTGGDAVVRVPKAGGAARVVAGGVPLPRVDSGLVADAGALYWGTGGAVWRATLKTGRVEKLVDSPEVFPARLAADGKWIYWSNSSDDNAGVWRAPKAGGAAEQVAGTGFDEVASFVVAPPWLYYVARGAVLKLRLEHGEDEKPVRVAEGIEVERSGGALLIAAEDGSLSSLRLDDAARAPVFAARRDVDPATLAADPAGLFAATAAGSDEDAPASILRFAP